MNIQKFKMFINMLTLNKSISIRIKSILKEHEEDNVKLKERNQQTE